MVENKLRQEIADYNKLVELQKDIIRTKEVLKHLPNGVTIKVRHKWIKVPTLKVGVISYLEECNSSESDVKTEDIEESNILYETLIRILRHREAKYKNLERAYEIEYKKPLVIEIVTKE